MTEVDTHVYVYESPHTRKDGSVVVYTKKLCYKPITNNVLDEEQKQKFYQLCDMGVKKSRLGSHLNIDEKTVNKYYRFYKARQKENEK